VQRVRGGDPSRIWHRL